MPVVKRRVKRETRVVKVGVAGRLKTTEQTACGRAKDIRSASQTSIPSVCQSRREKLPRKGARSNSQFVPVVNHNKKPLMPCHPARARELLKTGRATKRWNKGMFYIQMKEKTDEHKQEVAIGIDPGSKWEGFSVKSEAHTYFNLQADAITWVKERMEVRRDARKRRRQRKTPCRKNKINRNRSKNWLAPSTKARWQWKLRIINRFCKIYPITHFIVEDIGAKTIKGARKWNVNFSPLEVGKNWFYKELEKIAPISTKKGHETAKLREDFGLNKNGNKSSKTFDAHCVDAWILANDYIGGHIAPDNTNIHFIKPIQLHKRQLHVLQPTKGGKRKNYGGTISLGLKRGSLVKHKKYGICIVGGNSNGRVSLHDKKSGKRLSRDARIEDIEFLCYCSWYF